MKIFLDTIGCRLNQAEIESLACQFRVAGNEIVPSAGEADMVVVNTCTVTAEAASDSRAAIRRAKRLGAGDIVVTGCWATLEPDKAATLPGVTRIFPNLQKDNLVADLAKFSRDPSSGSRQARPGGSGQTIDLEPIVRQPLPGLHLRTRAFIKAQDGCDCACTFCITTQARGASRSRPLDEIINNIEYALDGGAKEIVLTGVALGSWGLDVQPSRRIGDLVAAILARTSVPRLRLSSLEPWDLDEEFFSLWLDPSTTASTGSRQAQPDGSAQRSRKSPRLCRHLHLPLQSGSASVLRRMARKTTPDDFTVLVRSALTAIPEAAITTDLIVGFPGETDEEFAETLEFVKQMNFAGGHVFSYSKRPGTPAARMKGQVPGEVIKARSAALRNVLAESAEAYHRKFIGKTMPVLWEAMSVLTDSGWQIEGLTDNYLRVTAIAPEPRWNRVDEVFLTRANAEGCSGEIQK